MPENETLISDCCLAGLETLSTSHLTKQSPVSDYPKCSKCGKTCQPIPKVATDKEEG